MGASPATAVSAPLGDREHEVRRPLEIPEDPRRDIGYVHAPAPKPKPPRARVVGTVETGDAVFGPWAGVVARADGKTSQAFGRSEGEAADKALEIARRLNGGAA